MVPGQVETVCGKRAWSWDIVVLAGPSSGGPSMKVHPAGTELLPGYWVARQVEIPFFPKPAQCVLRKPGKVDQRQIRVHLRIPTVPQQLSLLVCESQESRPSASLAMTRVSGGL